ncbi:MAG TPA: hypothetical protein VGL63_11495 [Streptosporangiaceae bacterium]
MNRRGVGYDVGTVFSGFPCRICTRPRFDAAIVHRELEIIKNDLGCNAVRITGRDPGRLITAAQDALRQGLEVWLAPALFEKEPDETLTYYVAVATAAEPLRRQFGDRLVLGVGGELSLFMRGIAPGRTVVERLAHLRREAIAGSNQPAERLNEFLGRASEAVRAVFRGPLTYASLIGEWVDWGRFDFVGVDHYRDARIKDRYIELLAPLLRERKPVVVTEVGMRAYRGAEDSGTLGFGVVDERSRGLSALPLVGRFVRARLNGAYVRDEELQARELTEVLAILDAAGVDGAFVSSFADPISPYSDDPRYDLDMSALSLVKTYAGGRGTTYPDMPWEPKAAFRAVAKCYAGGLAGA